MVNVLLLLVLLHPSRKALRRTRRSVGASLERCHTRQARVERVSLTFAEDLET